MSVASPSIRPAHVVAELPLYSLLVAQYYAMLEAGILCDDDPVELIDGILIQRTRKSPRHVVARELLLKALGDVLPAGWIIRIQSALHLAHSMPEPDLAVVRGG